MRTLIHVLGNTCLTFGPIVMVIGAVPNGPVAALVAGAVMIALGANTLIARTSALEREVRALKEKRGPMP